MLTEVMFSTKQLSLLLYNINNRTISKPANNKKQKEPSHIVSEQYTRV